MMIHQAIILILFLNQNSVLSNEISDTGFTTETIAPEVLTSTVPSEAIETEKTTSDESPTFPSVTAAQDQDNEGSNNIETTSIPEGVSTESVDTSNDLTETPFSEVIQEVIFGSETPIDERTNLETANPSVDTSVYEDETFEVIEEVIFDNETALEEGKNQERASPSVDTSIIQNRTIPQEEENNIETTSISLEVSTASVDTSNDVTETPFSEAIQEVIFGNETTLEDETNQETASPSVDTTVFEDGTIEVIEEVIFDNETTLEEGTNQETYPSVNSSVFENETIPQEEENNKETTVFPTVIEKIITASVDNSTSENGTATEVDEGATFEESSILPVINEIISNHTEISSNDNETAIFEESDEETTAERQPAHISGIEALSTTEATEDEYNSVDDNTNKPVDSDETNEEDNVASEHTKSPDVSYWNVTDTIQNGFFDVDTTSEYNTTVYQHYNLERTSHDELPENSRQESRSEQLKSMAPSVFSSIPAFIYSCIFFVFVN